MAKGAEIMGRVSFLPIAGKAMAGSFVVLAVSAGVHLHVAHAETPSAGQTPPVTDQFLRETSSETAETSVSIDTRLLEEPVLGARLVSGSVGGAKALEASAVQDAADAPEFFRTYMSNEDWRVTHETKTYLSALGTRWLFTGGAHGNSGFSSVIWEKPRAGRMGREVDVASFFRNGASADAEIWPLLSTFLYDAWEREWEARTGESVTVSGQGWHVDAQKTLAQPAPSDMASVVTLVPSTEPGKAGGLAFHFAPYELGPYAMGTFSFTVPQQVFRPHLTVEATELFGGDALTDD